MVTAVVFSRDSQKLLVLVLALQTRGVFTSQAVVCKMRDAADSAQKLVFRKLMCVLLYYWHWEKCFSALCFKISVELFCLEFTFPFTGLEAELMLAAEGSIFQSLAFFGVLKVPEYNNSQCRMHLFLIDFKGSIMQLGLPF